MTWRAIRRLPPIEIDLGELYRQRRGHIGELLVTAAPSAWTTPVPACPGWDVKAVVSHLVGVIEDGMAGRLTGPPDDMLSAEEVARHAGDQPGDLLAQWDRLAPPFEQAISLNQIWPALLDVLSHEHDIRGALGLPGGRDDEIVDLASRRLVEGIELSGTVAFDVGDDVLRTAPVGGPTHVVATSAFEVVRLRLGRRSRAQVVAMSWDPEPPGSLVDELFVFGPRETPLVE